MAPYPELVDGLTPEFSKYGFIPPVAIFRRPLRGVSPTGRRLELELFFYF